MAKKTEAREREPDVDERVWIRPTFSLRGKDGDRAWGHRLRHRNQSRILELADIALGFRKRHIRRNHPHGNIEATRTWPPNPYRAQNSYASNPKWFL